MGFQPLQLLAESYPAEESAALVELAGRYEGRQEQEILDIAAIAADVSTDSILNLGLEPELDPQVMEAFRLQYPHQELRSLVDAPQESLNGWRNGIKGKYFEIIARDRLNSGESLGELTLGPGQVARLAESPTQEGFDLEIVNTDDGSIAELLQLKATDSMSYVKHALDRYPDIRIATTSEIDGVSEEILQTDVSDEHLEEVVERQMGELSEDAVTDALDQSAEFAFDAFPLFPAILVGVTEGRQVLLGRSSLDESLRRGSRRLGKSAVFSTLGATFHALDGGVLSFPVAMTTRVAWKRVSNRIAMGDSLQSKTEEIRLLTAGNAV